MMMMKTNPAAAQSESEENKQGEQQLMKRSCEDCHTTRTPLWRRGPDGSRSLCNACGIRYRKQRSALLGLGLGLGQGREEKNKRKRKRRGSDAEVVSSVVKQLRLMAALGSGSREREKKKKKLGEVEEAAILLMALSSPLHP